MFGFGTPVNRTPANPVKLVRETGSAVPLTTISQQGGADLLKKTEAAGAALERINLAGVRAQVAMLLDYSGSMSNDYANGNVQKLVERALAFGLQMDADGEIPVVPFASDLLPTIDVNLGNYKTAIRDGLLRQYMGSTNLTAGLQALRQLAQVTDAPVFCIIVTDGDPDDQSSATDIVCDLARYPVFLKFVALYNVPYLDKLDNLGDSKRLLDNVNTQSFSHLNQSDEEFAAMMAEEFESWVKKALEKGVLTQ